jgi:hypothetical protein
MKKANLLLFIPAITALLSCSCKKQMNNPPPNPNHTDTPFVNLSHLNNLFIPVIFPGGNNAGGIYIYSAYPDYHPVEATGEGFTCVDDVSRASLVYFRNDGFATDTSMQRKGLQLIRFLLNMQAGDGYFYNFFQSDGTINTNGTTSMATQNWWSWRALQALTETGPAVKNLDMTLGSAVDLAVQKLMVNIKADLVPLPKTTEVISGITVPQWLPAGSATDQASTLILGLIPYCEQTNDTLIRSFIRKLADGIVLMQEGNANVFPYSLILSAQNQWHGYGTDQSLALLLAGEFLTDTSYTARALAEINDFYPWFLANGSKSSISLSFDGILFQPGSEKNYDQIAYGYRPMVFAAAEAYAETGQAKYADIAGHIASWFLGNNDASTIMYDSASGRCFDAITGPSQVNLNSGAESTIEALLTVERVQKFPAIHAALYSYKKQ